MLYKKGFIHVDMKYSTPDIFVIELYMKTNVTELEGGSVDVEFSVLELPAYVVSNRWTWNGAQQIKNASTTTTNFEKKINGFYFSIVFLIKKNLPNIFTTCFVLWFCCFFEKFMRPSSGDTDSVGCCWSILLWVTPFSDG
jgi:hypothetical protein